MFDAKHINKKNKTAITVSTWKDNTAVVYLFLAVLPFLYYRNTFSRKYPAENINK